MKRPVSAAGVTRWDVRNVDDMNTTYLINEGQHHLRESLNAENVKGDKQVTSWLSDQPYDIIVEATATALGDTVLQELAEEAEKSQEFYLAACRWHAHAMLLHRVEGRSAATPFMTRCLDALGQARTNSKGADPSGQFTAFQRNMLDLTSLRYVIMSVDVELNLKYADRIDAAVKSDAAIAEPESGGVLMMMSDGIPAMFAGDMVTAVRTFNVMCDHLITKGVLAAPDESTRLICAVMAGGFGEWYNDMMCLADSWPGYEHRYGVGGAHLRKAIEGYNYSHHHHYLAAFANNDFWLSSPGGALVMALHYGDLATAHVAIDNHLLSIVRQANEPNQGPEAFGIAACVCGALLQICHMLGRDEEARTVLTKTGYSWRDADRNADKVGEMLPFVRTRGETSTAGAFLSVEALAWDA
eukprot:SAG22_NODE_315_length_12535_cov_3.240351_15_plen_413_part_00